MTEQNYINHIVLVLDGSLSMRSLSSSLIAVADNQIAYLAQRSRELDQETRVTVYSFNSRNTAKCLIYDKDVLRMPSIKNLYTTNGMTALVDAVMLSLDDLAMTPEKYGEHAFLVYVLTDGQENNSSNSPSTLKTRISRLPDHWTIAAFVPDQSGVFEAKKFGFPADNIAIWDTSAKGVAEVGEVIRRSTDTFMTNRSSGIRGTKSLFRLKDVSATDIKSNLHELDSNDYALFSVNTDSRIDEFMTSHTGRFQLGKGYYQLTKTEIIQGTKQIAILFENRVYIGQQARTMLGLPNENVKVPPDNFKDYKIFVQSTAPNRKLLAGTDVLILR